MSVRVDVRSTAWPEAPGARSASTAASRGAEEKDASAAHSCGLARLWWLGGQGRSYCRGLYTHVQPGKEETDASAAQ